MSDPGRKDFSTSTCNLCPWPTSGLTLKTEMKEELTPDSSKSTQQKMKEGFTDTTDRAAGKDPCSPC